MLELWNNDVLISIVKLIISTSALSPILALFRQQTSNNRIIYDCAFNQAFSWCFWPVKYFSNGTILFILKDVKILSQKKEKKKDTDKNQAKRKEEIIFTKWSNIFPDREKTGWS